MAQYVVDGESVHLDIRVPDDSSGQTASVAVSRGGARWRTPTDTIQKLSVEWRGMKADPFATQAASVVK